MQSHRAIFKIPATFKQNIIASTKLNTNHSQKYARILQPFLFWERYLTLLPNGQHIRFYTVYCITFIIQHQSFLNKIVQKL